MDINRREFLSRVSAASLAASMNWTLANAGDAPGAAPRSVRPKLETFDYRGVTLLPSRWQRQVEQAREVYFNLPNDDLLKGFRRKAGLPAPGQDLNGWGRDTCAATFGQWLSGMARLSRALGDTALRDKAIALAEGWKQTLPARGGARMDTYAWEKMVCGLVDLALYADYDPNLALLGRITESATRRFDRSRSPATPLDRDGRQPHGTLEWYTLPENLYRAYVLSGQEMFRDFARVWHYSTYWDKFENNSSPEGVAFLHSYSHVNTFCGAAMAYAVTGEERYLRILRHGCEFVQRVQAYATGVGGPGEWSVPPDGTLGRALEVRSDSAEVPCGSWAGFKLSRYMLGFTGEAAHAGWIETLLYNAIGAALPVQPDGRTFYYADYRLGSACKLYHWDEWPCCSGTYLQTVADYHNVIYFKDEAGLYVGLFVPSEVTWSHQGREVVLRQETQFPESDETVFTFRMHQPVQFHLRVRQPAWSGPLRFTLNGAPLAARETSGGWLGVDRVWNPGDKLVLTLAPSLALAPVDPQHPRRAAVKFGPVLLSQEARFTFPLELRGQELAEKLTRESDDLHFRVNDRGTREQRAGGLQPYYQVPERIPYRVYFDLDEPRYL